MPHSKTAPVLLFLSAALLFCAAPAAEPSRPPAGDHLTLEEQWRFRLDDHPEARNPEFDDSAWSVTRIPHNGQGLTDDVVFSRAARPLWLRRAVDLPALAPGDRVLLQVTRTAGVKCWLNGHEAGTTAANQWTFFQDVTPLARAGRNVLALQTTLPGIQGYVRLHVLPALHLDPRGLRVDLPGWKGGGTSVRLRTQVENHSDEPRTVTLRAAIFHPDGRRLATVDSSPVRVAPRGTAPVTLNSGLVAQPPLWSPDTPQLCSVNLELLEGGRPAQRQSATFGFRWHEFRPDGAFLLNGQPYPIRGVVYVEPAERRFPDRQALWEYEIGLLKGMGVNFVRTSRTIDQSFLAACDRAGLLVTEPIHFLAPGDIQASDIESLVHEAYNHPCLIAWHTNGEGKDAAGARALSETAQFARKHDPMRSVLCCELGWRSPGTVGLVDADIAGQGNYTGWYEGTLDHIGPYLDDYRALLRERYGRPLPVVVSNYGAAGVADLHTHVPRRNDFSHTYHTAFNERFYAEMKSRPWLAGGIIFCWRDLNTPQPIPRHTWKGMLDLQDRKKDAYYFYQSRWTQEPMVHLAGKTWTQRDAWPAETPQVVKVFSNCEEVELFHDGRSLGTRREQDHRFEWQVRFRAGPNRLLAVARRGEVRVEDSAEIALTFRPPAVEPRLVSRPARDGRPERVLAWTAIPGADRYTVYTGSSPDFPTEGATELGTTGGAEFILPDGPVDRYYKVSASAAGSSGPASIAVGLKPGTLRWRFEQDGWLLSSPAVADLNGDDSPEIVIGSYNGKVYAVRADGTLHWSADLVDPVQASPAIASLRRGEPPSVVINSNRALYVLSAEGKVIWKRDGIRQFDRTVRSPSLVDLDGDGTLEILVGTDTGRLLALEADGRTRWEFSTAVTGNHGLSPTSTVVVDRPDGAGKALCFTADSGILYCLDARGRPLWQRDLRTGDGGLGLPPNHLTPAAGLVEDSKRTTIVVGGAALEALSVTGDPLWQRADRTGFPQISNLFRDGSRQIVVAARRSLYVLDENGRDLWNYTLPHPRDYFLQAPVSADLDADGEPDLIAGTRATNMVALSSRGQKLWNFTCQDELTGTPAVADLDRDGLVDVIFGCRDGYLYVVSGGQAPPYAQESPSYRNGHDRAGAYAPAKGPVSGRFKAPGTARSFENVAYGADPLQKLDVYLPAATRPTGVLIEFHGGGWRRGHKRQLDVYGDLCERALDRGIAVVSANYRLTPAARWPAQAEDAARVVQFVRSKATEWNLDPARVVLIGGSAGGHLSLWVGLNDDRAKPASTDPVQRQSTRVRGIIDCWAPTDLARIEMIGRAREALPELLGCPPEAWAKPEVARLIREISPINYVSADDPPVFIVHTESPKPIPAGPDWKTADVHSVLYGQLLEQKLRAAGVPATLVAEKPAAAPHFWVGRALEFLDQTLR